MKSKKLAGIRLFNYLNDGINWKDHKDIILDYWIKNIAPQYNRSPDKLQGFVTVESLPTAVQKEYEDIEGPVMDRLRKWYIEYFLSYQRLSSGTRRDMVH